MIEPPEFEFAHPMGNSTLKYNTRAGTLCNTLFK